MIRENKMNTAEKFYGKTEDWQPRTKPMEVKVLKRENHLLKLKVEGEKHTLFSPLREELYNDDDVKFVAYREEHPLLENVVFEVKTKTKTPLEALQDAIKRMHEKINEMQKEFKRTFERGLTNPEFIESDKWEEYLEEK